MKKIIYISLIFFLSNCNLNKVVKNHGVNFLEKKQEKLTLNISNKNDITKLLGPPSTKSFFDNDLLIYIERKQSKKSVFKLGKRVTITNNALILELDNRGILIKKDFLDINDMNKLVISKKKTGNEYAKDSFIYNFLTSLRTKINDPLGKRRKY